MLRAFALKFYWPGSIRNLIRLFFDAGDVMPVFLPIHFCGWVFMFADAF